MLSVERARSYFEAEGIYRIAYAIRYSEKHFRFLRLNLSRKGRTIFTNHLCRRVDEFIKFYQQALNPFEKLRLK